MRYKDAQNIVPEIARNVSTNFVKSSRRSWPILTRIKSVIVHYMSDLEEEGAKALH